MRTGSSSTRTSSSTWSATAATGTTRVTTPATPSPSCTSASTPGALPHVDTGVDRATLDRLYARLATPPEGFTMHPKLARQLETRDKMVASGEVDWALAELLAYASLLDEGTNVRLAGQDSRRGTF